MVRRSLLGLLIMVTAATVWSQQEDLRYRRWRNSKPPIEKITIEGNEHYSDADVTDRLYSRERTFWSSLKGDRRTRLQRESLSRDTLEVKYLYLTNGFLSVRVDERFEVNLPDSSAHIIVQISEGPQSRYGEARVEGECPSGTGPQITGIAHRLESGRPTNLFELRQMAFEMKGVLANHGYPYGEVAFQVDSLCRDSLCPVIFRVNADSLVHYGQIAVAGIERYSEKTVRRESKMKTGAVYRRQDIIDTRRRLVESGYFSTLSITQSDSSLDRYRPDFQLRVRERPPIYTTFTNGIGRSDVADLEWDVSAGFGKRNFLGSRRYDLTAVAKFGIGDNPRLLEHRYQISYTEPWLLHIRMPLVLSARWEPGVKDPVYDYRIERWSLAASTTRRFGEEYLGQWGLEYQVLDIYGVAESAKEEIKKAKGIAVRRKLYMTLRRDSRDHVFIPRRGSLTELSAQFFGGFLGGDHHFVKLEASWSSYQVVWPGWVSATRIKSGWAEPFGASDDVPPDDQFYLGGANTVRGFRVNTLGPVDTLGAAMKSNYIVVFNEEFRWQTIQVHQFIPLLGGLIGSWPLWQSVFFDAGNGFLDIEDSALRRLAYSYGTGIQIVSPAGPIRIDYARRIKTEFIDFEDRWHFTILYAF